MYVYCGKDERHDGLKYSRILTYAVSIIHIIYKSDLGLSYITTRCRALWI